MTPRVLELVGVSEEPDVRDPATLRHATFVSPSMQVEVGYCVYLPPGYADSANADRRYPVV